MEATNPFIISKSLPVKRIKKTYSKSKNDTADEIDRIELGKIIFHLDDQPFVKVYEGAISILDRFKPNDYKLFEFICYQLLIETTRYKDEEGMPQYHSIDKVKLVAGEVLLELNDRSLKRSIISLTTFNIIKKAEVKDYYWINPYMIFIGDRSAKYKRNLEIINNNEDRLDAYVK